MDELVAFLRGCLDEDERVARAGGEAMDADNPSWPDYATYDGPDIDAAVAYLKQFRPARVLREVESKRALVDLHQPYGQKQSMARGEIWACSECGDVDDNPTEWPCTTLRLLAAVYSDRLGYQEEWKP